MTSRSPKTPKNKNKKNSVSSSSKKSSRANSLVFDESIEQYQRETLLPGQFYVNVKPTEISETKRPRPLRVSLNMEVIQQLNLVAGDFVFVQKYDEAHASPNFALGIVWPSQSILAANCQLSEILCENCKVEADDVVQVSKVDCKVISTPLVFVQIISDQDRSLLNDLTFPIYMKEVLIDLEYFICGQKITTNYFGTARTFILSQEPPSDQKETIFIGRISRSTQIKFSRLSSKKQDTKHNQTSYKSIGGLKDQVKAIKEMIELPLFNAERFLNLGLQPPRGLLLYGPAGTGKTLIARAIAQETGAHVVILNASDIISEYAGVTEAKLKNAFDEANGNEPSLIFIDEIDALCPSRNDNSTDAEKRVVACLLTLMDGLDKNYNVKISQRPRVVIMGATNRPNAIDSALRRPGRFDREFEIGIPSPESRFKILSILLEPIKHSLTSEEIREISDKAHGYVGADLAAICREAGLNVIKRIRKQMVNVETPDEQVEDVVIRMKDMLAGMTMVKPSVIRDISLQVPKVYWDQIGGQHDIKQKLKEAVEWPLKNPEVFLKFNIKPPKGLLLYGPPGCSKTLMAKALATEAGLNFLAVKGPELFSKWVGESEKAVQQIFKKARAAAPSVIFFDEIDALAVKRSGDSAVADRVLSQLLMEMDGMEPLVNVTVIAATNRPDILDSALLRPGRIDSILYVSPPDLPSRAAIFRIQLKRIPTNGVDPLVLAELTEGFSGAEVVAVCQNAAAAVMMESLDATFVEMKHFLDAISKTIKRITPEMLEFYQRFKDRSGLASV